MSYDSLTKSIYILMILALGTVVFSVLMPIAAAWLVLNKQDGRNSPRQGRLEEVAWILSNHLGFSCESFERVIDTSRSPASYYNVDGEWYAIKIKTGRFDTVENQLSQNINKQTKFDSFEYLSFGELDAATSPPEWWCPKSPVRPAALSLVVDKRFRYFLVLSRSKNELLIHTGAK